MIKICSRKIQIFRSLYKINPFWNKRMKGSTDLEDFDFEDYDEDEPEADTGETPEDEETEEETL